MYFFINSLVLLILATDLCVAMSSYEDGEKVDVFVKSVGPYYNPQETYSYSSLPGCHRGVPRHKPLTLWDVLENVHLEYSDYDIKFRETKEKAALCTLELGVEEVKQLRRAVKQNYLLNLEIDDLSTSVFIGGILTADYTPEGWEESLCLYTEYTFTLRYNGNEIISVNASIDGKSPVVTINDDEPMSIPIKYSVLWQQSAVLQKYRGRLETGNFPHKLEVHWVSVINSLIILSFLLGPIIFLHSRSLWKDLAKYNARGDDFIDERRGWKVLHGDVFRLPPYKSLLSSILGVGTQFLVMGLVIIFLGIAGMLRPTGSINVCTAIFLIYIFTSFISGAVSGSYYRKLRGKKWVHNTLLTIFLFPLPYFFVWALVNTINWVYGTSGALSVTTVLLRAGIWVLICFPLTIVGTIMGKNMSGDISVPCRTKNTPRIIPLQPWYKRKLPEMLVGGVLPFSTITIELIYLHHAIWGRNVYSYYGILFLVVLITILVSGSVSITLTYLQLKSENHAWWWRSVTSVGSAAFYLFFHSIFFFFKRSDMSGMVQTVEYFGYIFLACLALFLTLGTVSYFASFSFIRYIYGNLKVEVEVESIEKICDQ